MTDTNKTEQETRSGLSDLTVKLADGTCGTCEYKGDSIKSTDDDGYEIDTGYFLCNGIEHDSDCKFLRGQKGVVQDGSGYYAALCVETDFGCIKWKAANAELRGAL